MVDARIKLAYIKLEAVFCALGVCRQILTQFFMQRMNAAPFYTGVRVCGELRGPYRFKHLHDCPLNYTIPERQLVNLTPLGLILYKNLVGRSFISPFQQLGAQFLQVVAKL